MKVYSFIYPFFIFFIGNTSPNTPHTSANLVMTPQGQLLTLKGPLFSGPVVTVSPALLETDLKPQVASSSMAQSGMSCCLLWVVKKVIPDSSVTEKVFECIL